MPTEIEVNARYCRSCGCELHETRFDECALCYFDALDWWYALKRTMSRTWRDYDGKPALIHGYYGDPKLAGYFYGVL